jgi:hypothetical protein
MSGMKGKSTWSYSRLEALKRLSKTMNFKQLSDYFRLSDPAIRSAYKKYVKKDGTDEK